MIPRLKPALSTEELTAALRPGAGAVQRFEARFAGTFGTRYAIAFSYGRSALWAVLKALGIRDSEVVMPAYTCVVVAHATLLSGNEPRFVDIRLVDYTMDLDQLADTITARTAVVLPTHLFGYPMDVGAVREIVRDAERRFGRRILIIQDCAHSFGARFQGCEVTSAPDLALFGLNISKLITSIFGGMLATDDAELAERIRRFRDESFVAGGIRRRLRRLAYLAAAYPAFNRQVYTGVRWLESSTPLLDRLTKAYHLDELVRFPPDYMERFSPTEAAVGLVQLGKYSQIVDGRRAHAAGYYKALEGIDGFHRGPLVDGATYSHYVGRTANRDAIMAYALRRGIQLGHLVEYSIPEMDAYRQFGHGHYPNAQLASRSMINLPVHAGVTVEDRDRVVEVIRDAAAAASWDRAAIRRNE